MLTNKRELIESQVRSIIAKIMEIEESKITGDTNLVEELGADSMMVIEIMVTLDKKFKINIEESDLPKMTSFNKIVDIVESLSGE